MSAQLMQVPQDAVFLKNGHAVTTSLKVAEVFGKPHKNVLRDIKLLGCSEEFARLNFEPGFYSDANSQPRPMFEMTKDGFTFLVMGFTGSEAARFKEDYIRAFNLMAEAVQVLVEPPRKMEVDEAEYWKMKAELAELKLEREIALGRRRRNATPEDEATIITLVRRGMGRKEIGSRIGRTANGVDAIIDRLRREGRL